MQELIRIRELSVKLRILRGDYLVTGEAAMTWVATNQLISLANAAGRD